MKFLIILVSFMCMVLSSCTKTTATSIAEELQNNESIHVAGVGKIYSCFATENCLIFVTDASDRGLNYDITADNNPKENIGANAMVSLCELGIADKVLDSDINVTYRFEWNDGRVIDAFFSNSELKALKKSLFSR